MPDADKLTPADPSDLAAALAFALRYQGRKRVHNADEIMAEIVAKRLFDHLKRAGFVVVSGRRTSEPQRWDGDLRTLDHRDVVWPALRKLRSLREGLANGSYPTLC